MRPSTIDIDVADESTTGFDTGLTGAGPFTPAVTTPTDSLAHQVSLTSGQNLSAITLTLTGTDPDGKAQTEDVTGPNANTVESTKYFLTLTTITASSTLGANTLDAGWVDEVMSATFPIDRMSPYAANLLVDITGTINFTVQEAWYNIYDSNTPSQSSAWVNITALASKTADTGSVASEGVSAIRILTNSYSTGAELQLYVNQATDH